MRKARRIKKVWKSRPRPSGQECISSGLSAITKFQSLTRFFYSTIFARKTLTTTSRVSPGIPTGGSTVVEVAGNHAIYVSRPRAVAALIEKASREVKPVRS